MPSSLIDDAPEGVNTPEFSVSEISGAVKRLIEGEFARVRVRGEIGRVSRPRSGHIYLDLKDDRAVLAAVVWKGAAGRLGLEPREGDEVIAEGKLTTFPGQSKYQLVIERCPTPARARCWPGWSACARRWPPRGCSTRSASARSPICPG